MTPATRAPGPRFASLFREILVAYFPEILVACFPSSFQTKAPYGCRRHASQKKVVGRTGEGQIPTYNHRTSVGKKLLTKGIQCGVCSVIVHRADQSMTLR